MITYADFVGIGILKNLGIIMKINLKNSVKIQAEIDAAQKGCSARTIDIEVIKNIAKKAEQELKMLGIAAGNRKGANFTFRNGYGRFSASYRNMASSTYFSICRGSRGWFLTRVYRSTAKCSERLILNNMSEMSQFFNSNA